MLTLSSKQKEIIAKLEDIYRDTTHCAQCLWLDVTHENNLQIHRKKRWEKFVYLQGGRKIKNTERFSKLWIAPSRTEVIYSDNEKWHLQAIAVDGNWHKQYVYHTAWEKNRNMLKFFHIISVIIGMQSIRDHYTSQIKSKWKEYESAICIKTLDKTWMRIWNFHTTQLNWTYGLTTLEWRHIEVKKDVVTFSFTWKAWKENIYALKDKDIAEYVKNTHNKEQVFEINEQQCNKILEEYSFNNTKITAKDLRLLQANSCAVEILWENNPHTLKNFLSPIINTIQNTPSVAQHYYVYSWLTDIVRQNKIRYFKEQFKYTKPTKYLSTYEHILFKYMLNEVHIAQKMLWL